MAGMGEVLAAFIVCWCRCCGFPCTFGNMCAAAVVCLFGDMYATVFVWFGYMYTTTFVCLLGRMVRHCICVLIFFMVSDFWVQILPRGLVDSTLCWIQRTLAPTSPSSPLCQSISPRPGPPSFLTCTCWCIWYVATLTTLLCPLTILVPTR